MCASEVEMQKENEIQHKHRIKLHSCKFTLEGSARTTPTRTPSTPARGNELVPSLDRLGFDKSRVCSPLLAGAKAEGELVLRGVFHVVVNSVLDIGII